MKESAILVILIFCFLASGYSQAKFKVINGITKQPIKDQYCNIIQDNDTWVDIGNTDDQGIFKPDVSADSNKNYQLWISAEGYKPFKQDINLHSDKLVTVSIYPDSGFIKKVPNLVYSGCSSIYFGKYRPKTPNSIDDLPDSIKEKLVNHLVARLGYQFYLNLKLSGGQIVNLERLYIVEMNAKNYKWIPYSYYLCFSFQDVSKGIGLYTAQIVLDKNGNIVKEIQFPNIESNPEKANLISRESAITIAKNNNFDIAPGRISLEYDLAKGSLVWCFEKVTDDNGLSFSLETLIVDAHTGKILGTKKGSGIR
ncbi:MAG: PepSY domain-containing protein [Chitinophagaceae bacterium]|nr:PepSY domain-containing protein [Chitinophagaceae bacterium]